jgi:copper(I)-binding protein
MLACGLGISAAAAAGSVTVEHPWMRFIIKARPAAGYFTLRNNSDTAKQLTGASSSACGMLMMHQSKQEDGVDKMLPVKSVAVPAHGLVEFAPGGYHLMCMSPTNAMAIGAQVPVTLRFSDGASVTASFPVKGPGGK